MKKKTSLFLWILLFLCPGVKALSPQKYYVKESATGSGTSWIDAAADLQLTINNASPGDTVFVAAGRYYAPLADNKGFRMKEGVNVYGGFSGEGVESFVNQIDTVLYKTYLDGSSATRVITQDVPFGVKTEWGGFIVCNGRLESENTSGGGVFLLQGGKISNSTIINNYTYATDTALGGGVYNKGGQVESCTVKENKIWGGGTYGAGIYNERGSVTNCVVVYNDAEANTFFSNVVAAGGGIYNREGIIINTLSARNTVYAYTIVAAYSWGAGIYNSQGQIINCTITDNMSDATADAYTYSAGAGIYNQGDACRIVNTILWGNKVDTSVNNIYNNGTPVYLNSLVEGKSANDLDAENNNLDGTSPRLLFTDSFNEDYRLLPYSDAINAGKDDENTTLSDVAGNSRKYGVIDLGAYEYQGEKLNAQVEFTTAKKEAGNIRFRIAGVEPGNIIVNFGDGIPVGYQVDNNPIEIIHKIGPSKSISIYTSVYTPYITLFDCRNDSITTLDIADNIASIDCSLNLLKVSTLPEKKDGWANYIYHPQKDVFVKNSVYPSDTIDLSSELIRGGIITSYQWKSKNTAITLVEGVDYSIEQGITTFLKSQTDSVYCELKNQLFPELILTTNKVKVHKLLPVLNIESEQITYTGENIHIRPAYQTNTFNNIPLALTYRYVSESGWDRPYATDAGEYKVIAYCAGDENHEPATSNVATLVIKKAVPSIYLTSKAVPYTGAPILIDKPVLEGTTTVNTLASALQYRYVGYKNTVYSSSATAPTQIGTYRVTVSSAGNTNHEAVSKSVLMSITKTKCVVSISDQYHTYDGTSKAMMPYIGDPSQNLLVKYIYEGVLANDLAYGPTSQAPVNAGKYTVEAIVENISDTMTVIANLTIDRKQPIFTVENKTASYTGARISSEVISVEPSSGAIYLKTYKGRGNTIYEEDTNAPVNVGMYSVSVSYSGSANYYPATQKATLQIVDKGHSSFVMKNKKVVYTGVAPTIDPLDVLPTDSVSVITYIYSGLDYLPSVMPPVNAGNYLVTASIVTTGVIGTKQVQSLLTIEKAQQQIEFDQDLLEDRQLVDQRFDVIATSSSGQSVTFASGNQDVARILSANTIGLTGLGVTSISAQVASTANYKAGVPVVRTLNVTSSDVTIHKLKINGQPHDINQRYIVDCSYTDPQIEVVIETGLNTVLSIDNQFYVDVSKAIVKRIDFTVTSQDGKTTQNYTLVIEKRCTDISIHELIIEGQSHDINERYVVDCSYAEENVTVSIKTGVNTKLEFANNTNASYIGRVDTIIPLPKATVKRIDFTVTSQDGSISQNYTLVIEKRFNHEDIVTSRTNNMLIAKASLDTRSISTYKWFKKVQGGSSFDEVGQGNTYITPTSGVFDPADIYYLEISTAGGETLRSCEFSVVLKSMEIKVYPNPVSRNEVAYLEADIDDDMLAEAITDVYSLSGELVLRFPLTGRITLLPTTFGSGLYILKVSSKGAYSRSTRFIIK